MDKNSTLLHEEIMKILQTFDSLSPTERHKLDTFVGKQTVLPKREKPFFEKVFESLQYIRIVIKYIMFDNEALRRENAYFRKMLKEQK